MEDFFCKIHITLKLQRKTVGMKIYQGCNVWSSAQHTTSLGPILPIYYSRSPDRIVHCLKGNEPATGLYSLNFCNWETMTLNCNLFTWPSLNLKAFSSFRQERVIWHGFQTYDFTPLSFFSATVEEKKTCLLQTWFYFKSLYPFICRICSVI